MDRDWLIARIDSAKAIVIALEEEMLAAIGSGVASFTMDTGQTRQVVTNRSPSEIKNALDSALNRVAVLEARLNGSAGYGGAYW